MVVLGAAILHGVSKVLVKVIVRTDSTMATVFHLNVQMSLFGLVPTLVFWQTPTLAHLGWFVVLAVVGAIAHYTLTRAIEHADLTALQPFEFVQLAWAALLGYAIFAEIPTNHVLLGGAVIVAATSYMSTTRRGAAGSLHDRRARPALPPPDNLVLAQHASVRRGGRVLGAWQPPPQGTKGSARVGQLQSSAGGVEPPDS